VLNGISIRCPIKLLLDPLEGDRIYSGSYKEFGYWYREGKMNVVSYLRGMQFLTIRITKRFGRF
jgi:hypothetical protein